MKTKPIYCAQNIIDILMLITSCLLIFTVCSDQKKNPIDNEDPDPVTDIDGNVYPTVRIGSQVWMAENLKVTHYNNGDEIPNITDAEEWENPTLSYTVGAYCYYDNDAGNGAIYGCMYNFYAIEDDRKLAPEGWHVATDKEWTTLVNYLGGEDHAGSKLKSNDPSVWLCNNSGTTNESGFSALPGGRCDQHQDFDVIGLAPAFWSSTEYGTFYAYYRHLECSNAGVYWYSVKKKFGFSVRCVKDK